MKLSKTNLWDSEADLICVTTNGCIGPGNALVMGRGSASEAWKRCSELPTISGNAIVKSRASLYTGKYRKYSIHLYGFLVIEGSSNPGNPFGSGLFRIGLFQSKANYAKLASLSLIGFSTMLLQHYLTKYSDLSVSMPFPGIGYGKLRRQDVLPIIKELPDRVTVHEHE